MDNVYLVSYDISDTKTRNKINKILINYGVRIQYSVFECNLSTLVKNEMIKKIKEVFNHYKIDEDFDNVRIYLLCEYCKKKEWLLAQINRIMMNFSLFSEFELVFL